MWQVHACKVAWKEVQTRYPELSVGTLDTHIMLQWGCYQVNDKSPAPQFVGEAFHWPPWLPPHSAPTAWMLKKKNDSLLEYWLSSSVKSMKIKGLKGHLVGQAAIA